jgi:hypothetical protein
LEATPFRHFGSSDATRGSNGTASSRADTPAAAPESTRVKRS